MRLDLPDEDALLVLLALRRAGAGKRLLGQAQQSACADLADRVQRIIESEASGRQQPPSEPVRWPRGPAEVIRPPTRADVVRPDEDPGRRRSWLARLVIGD